MKQTETVHGNALLPQGCWIYVSEAVLGVSERSWAHRSIQSSGRARAPRPPSSLRHPALCPQSLLALLPFSTGSFSARCLHSLCWPELVSLLPPWHIQGPPLRVSFCAQKILSVGQGRQACGLTAAFSREGALAVPLPVPQHRAGRRVLQRSPTQGSLKKVTHTEGTFQAAKDAFLRVLTLRPTRPGNPFPHLKVSLRG